MTMRIQNNLQKRPKKKKKRKHSFCIWEWQLYLLFPNGESRQFEIQPLGAPPLAIPASCSRTPPKVFCDLTRLLSFLSPGCVLSFLRADQLVCDEVEYIEVTDVGNFLGSTQYLQFQSHFYRN